MGKHEIPSTYSRRDLFNDVYNIALLGGTATAVSSALGRADGMYENWRRRKSEIQVFPELPPAVAAMQHSAVLLKNIVEGSALSGVVLDAHHVLTAGHGLRDAEGELLSYAGCAGAIQIHGLDVRGNPVKAQSRKVVSSFQDQRFYIPDVALIETIESLQALTYPRRVL